MVSLRSQYSVNFPKVFINDYCYAHIRRTPKFIENEKYLACLSYILGKTFPAGKIGFSIRVCIFSSRVYLMIVKPNIFLLIRILVVQPTLNVYPQKQRLFQHPGYVFILCVFVIILRRLMVADKAPCPHKDRINLIIFQYCIWDQTYDPRLKQMTCLGI